MGRVDKVLSEFWYLGSTKGLDKGLTKFDKRVAPVEFVFIGASHLPTHTQLETNLPLPLPLQQGVLLYVMRDYSHQDRAEAIYNMRMHIREQFKDVRNNSSVGRALWLFVRSIMQPGSVSIDAVLGSPAGKMKKRKKGKGGAGDDSEDDEYKPSPIRALGNAAKTRSKVAKQ